MISPDREKINLIMEWDEAVNHPDFNIDFIQEMESFLDRFGSLTDKQSKALDNIIRGWQIELWKQNKKPKTNRKKKKTKKVIFIQCPEKITDKDALNYPDDPNDLAGKSIGCNDSKPCYED